MLASETLFDQCSHARPSRFHEHEFVSSLSTRFDRFDAVADSLTGASE